MDASPTYTRLPGRGRGLGVYAQLWAGPDHVLHVESNGYTENYRRYYYRDIQAVVMQQNRHRAIGNFLLAFALALASVPAVVYGPGAGSLITPGVFLIFLLANTLLGPCCRVRLVTPINDQPLQNITRLAAYRRLMDRLLPMIERAQGALDPGQIAQQPVALPPRVTGAPRLHRRQVVANDDQPASRFCHGASALGFALFGALALVKVYTGHWMLFFAACLIFAITFPFVVFAIARQGSGRMDAGLKRWTWYALAFQVGGGVVSYFTTIGLAATGSEVGDLAGIISQGAAQGHTAVLAIHLLLALLALCLAGIGLLLVRRPPPFAPTPALVPPPLPVLPPPLPPASERPA